MPYVNHITKEFIVGQPQHFKFIPRKPSLRAHEYPTKRLFDCKGKYNCISQRRLEFILEVTQTNTLNEAIRVLLNTYIKNNNN